MKKYFSLYNHCYLVEGSCNHAIFDILQNRVFQVTEESHKLFLIMSRKGCDFDEISRHTNIPAEILQAYALYLETLDLGALYQNQKVSEKYRPFMHPFLIEKNGYYRKIDMLSLEVGTKCSMACPHCYGNKMHVTSTCCCGIYSDTPGIKYDIGKVIKDIAVLNPAMLELAGGDPFSNRRDLDLIIAAAQAYSISTVIKSCGALITENDIHELKQKNIGLNLIFCDLDISSATMVPEHLVRLLEWAAKCKYKALSIKLIGNVHNSAAIKNTSAFLSARRIPVDSIDYYFEEKDYLNKRPELEPLLIKNPHGFMANAGAVSRGISSRYCWQDKLAVMVNGDILPCIAAAPKYVLGNVINENLIDITREKRFEKNMNDNETDTCECLGCEFRLGCFTCNVLTHKLKCDPLAKAWNCTYKPAQGLWQLD